MSSSPPRQGRRLLPGLASVPHAAEKLKIASPGIEQQTNKQRADYNRLKYGERACAEAYWKKEDSRRYSKYNRLKNKNKKETDSKDTGP